MLLVERVFKHRGGDLAIAADHAREPRLEPGSTRLIVRLRQLTGIWLGLQVLDDLPKTGDLMG